MPEKPILGGKQALRDLTDLRESKGWQLWQKFVKEHCATVRSKMLHDLDHERFQDARCRLRILKDHEKLYELFDIHYQSLRKETEDANNNQ